MNKPVSMTPSQTLALVPVLVGLNFTLLMPAAQHANAGAFTHALPWVVMALTLILLVIGAANWVQARRS